MYTQFFSLRQAPFSIAPDPRYLFMTGRHREALAHLMYGINSGGGVVLLTGEIGAGKTTVCRCFLEQVPANCNVAYVFNPKLTVDELLHTICDEFHIRVASEPDKAATVKDYVDALTRHLLATHAEGKNNVLIIDEAQNLSADVLEQLRLLTNLETNERKLLQIILIGQPELRDMLDRPELRQLAQRVIARYHLTALSEEETVDYIQHRLTVAGLVTATPFQRRLVRAIHRLTQGVPRRINLLCDRALLGAYAEGKREVDRGILSRAASEVFGAAGAGNRVLRHPWRLATGGLMALVVAGAAAWSVDQGLYKTWLPAPVNRAGQGTISHKPVPSAPSVTSVTPVTPAAAVPPTAAATPSAPAPAASLPVAATLDDASTNGFRDEAQAVRQLATLWGQHLSGGDPCAAATQTGLICYRSANGLAELRQLDRPAVLTLQDSAGRAYYVLLTGLGDGSATLQAGTVTQTVSLVMLSRFFQGQYLTLWHTPEGYGGPVEPYSQSATVNWIARQLTKLTGEKEPDKPPAFDQRMMKRIREFQAAQGLKVDGLVGPVTFMHLNRVAGIDEPRLHSSGAVMTKAAATSSAVPPSPEISGK